MVTAHNFAGFSTHNQAFFPENLTEKLAFIRQLGFDGYEIDGRLLVNNLDAVKAAVAATGLPVSSACNGYTGWIGDVDDERRLTAVGEISAILRALAEVGGVGVVVPAAWGLWPYPHLTPFPRTTAADFAAVSASLVALDQVAAATGTTVFLEPLNRYQDHMINHLSDAARYISENELAHVQINADFYHMHQEEDDISQALRHQGNLVGHVHLADGHRYVPGSGPIDFPRHFATLREIGYSGWLVFECLMRGDDLAATYAESLRYVRACWDQTPSVTRR